MKKRKKNYVYSIRVSEEDNKLLKNSPDIKKSLDQYVRDYLKVFREK